MTSKLVTAFACLVLAGCATSGTKIDQAKVDTFEVGKTTCLEVIANMGPPQNDARNAAGQRTVTYLYQDSRSRPENFIPIIGSVVGGYDTKSTMLVVQCSPDDIVRDYTVSHGQSGTNQGLATQ